MCEIIQTVQLLATPSSSPRATPRAIKLILFLLFSMIPVSAAARELNGIQMPEGITVEGKPCRLNGLGVRTKTFLKIKVYVAGLYLEKPSDNAERIIAIDGARRLTLRMTHNAPKDRLREELMDGLERNSKPQLPALQARIEKLLQGVPDLKEGQALFITYLPGKGTSIQGTDGPEVTVSGKDVADALFSAWIGKDPLDDDLKQQLLGAPRQ